MTKYVKASMILEHNLWDQLKDSYGEKPYRQIRENEFMLEGVITRMHVRAVGSKQIYGRQGFWIDPEDVFFERRTRYRSGSIEVDLISGQVLVDQKPVSLNPSDFALLVYFMKSPKQLIPRSMLAQFLEARNNRVIQDNTITAHIGRIRKGLHDPGCIRTVNRVGYMWTRDVDKVSEPFNNA